MTEREKIVMLEEMLEVDENTLQADTLLNDVEEYDSMAKLRVLRLWEIFLN